MPQNTTMPITNAKSSPVMASHPDVGRSAQQAIACEAAEDEQGYGFHGHSTASKVISTGVTMEVSPVSLSTLRNALRV